MLTLNKIQAGIVGSSMVKGQCLCGNVSYIYHMELNNSILCFCLDCRQAQGGLFGWNSPINQSQFEIRMGSEYLKEYFHTSNKARVFCSLCASPIYSYRLDLPHILRLRLGTVVEGIIPVPNEQFYTHHKPDFIEVNFDSNP